MSAAEAGSTGRLAGLRKQARLRPAPAALLLQVLTAPAVLGVSVLFPQLTLGVAAALQGALACALSAIVGLPRWWMPIQLLFPLALLAALALALPTWLSAFAFLLLALVFWSTWRTRVPLFLSGELAWQTLAGQLPPHPLRIVDVGSGLGGLALYLARLRPDCQVRGIEIAPLPWLVSRLRAWLGRSRAQFLRADYQQCELSDTDVVFAYLSPAAMPGLWKKLQAELAPGALFLSYEFPVPDVPATFVLPCGSRTLYGWRLDRALKAQV